MVKHHDICKSCECIMTLDNLVANIWLCYNPYYANEKGEKALFNSKELFNGKTLALPPYCRQRLEHMMIAGKKPDAPL